MGITRARVLGALIAILLGAQVASGSTAQYAERLPRVKPRKLLPNAGGLVLGTSQVLRIPLG